MTTAQALRLLGFLAALGFAGAAGGREPPLSRYEYAELHMGVRARLVLYAPDAAAAERAASAAYRRFAELDAIMSDYRPASELMRLCAQSGGPPGQISDELFFVLRRALDLSELSQGAFDVTVGPFVTLWREARESGVLPDEAARREAGERVGWRHVRLDEEARTAQLLVPGMQLDLGGIAKGYACDEALRSLREHGIRRALVEAGGDLVAGDPPPGRGGWRVEVPGAGPGGGALPLTLANRAVATSGDTEQFVELGGIRYSHVVDPRTGLGLTRRAQATVLAPDGVTADGLATAACILGPGAGHSLVYRFPGARAFIRVPGYRLQVAGCRLGRGGCSGVQAFGCSGLRIGPSTASTMSTSATSLVGGGRAGRPRSQEEAERLNTRPLHAAGAGGGGDEGVTGLPPPAVPPVHSSPVSIPTCNL